MATKAVDGYGILPLQVGRTIIERPFRKYGDNDSIIVRRTYKQLATEYAPLALCTPDADYPDAYLIDESDPTNTETGLVQFTRSFARVPKTQTIPGSMFIAKPDIPGTFPQVFGGYVIFKPVDSVASYDAYKPQTVVGDSGAPGGLPSGGTYTLTFGANTTAGIAYNAAAATVQTALNGLASITAFGGVTVTGSSTSGFTITFSGYAAATAGVGSLTGSSASVAVGTTQNGLSQLVNISAVWPSPGFAATGSLTPAGAYPMYGSAGGGVYGTSLDSPANLTFAIGNAYYDVAATGGTYTLTVFGQTTAAIAYNANAATIAAALNALSNVVSRGGYTVISVPTSSINGNQNTPAFSAYLPSAQFTGGTYTITIAGQTTAAIAYNASTTAIQTAINALSNVTARGGVTVSGAGFTGDKISFTVSFANVTAITGSAASLTPSGVSLSVNSNTSYAQVLSFGSSTANTRLITVLNHGFTTADTLYFQDAAGTYYTALTSGISFPSANTIQITSTTGSAYSTASAIQKVGKRTIVGYAPSSVLTRVKFVMDFYLPTVTTGIATMDDIPLPTFQGDASSLLTAIFNGVTAINYQVGDLQIWNGPIYVRTTTQINATKL